jgi:hypothetical protein
MSHLLVDLIPCADVQEALNDVWGNGRVASEPLPLLMYLMSDTNTAGVEMQQIIAPWDTGKYRDVVLTYVPRNAESEVDETLETDCPTDGEEEGMLSQRYTLDINDGVQWKRAFNFDAVAAICKENPLYFAEIVMRGIDVLDRRIETRLHEDIAAGLYGSFASDDKNYDGSSITGDIKKIQTLYSDGKINRNFSAEIGMSARRNLISGAPALFGADTATKYVDGIEAGCCSEEGIDLFQFNSKFPYMYFDDYRITSTMPDGVNSVLMLEARALQLVWYNRYVGMNAKEGAHLVKRTVVSPRTGVRYDMIVIDNCDKLQIRLSVPYKLIGLPTDMYESGDRLHGSTGVWLFEIDNP